MSRGRRLSISILASLIAICAIAIFIHEKRKEDPSAPGDASRETIPVVSAVVASGAVPIYLKGVGIVAAYNTVVVRSQIQGQIVQINFREGQAVKPGDVLAEIDAKPYQAQLDQMQANKARDQAALTNAQTNFDRSTQLISKGFATQQLLDSQKAQVTQLQNTVASDEAQVEQAKVQLG